MKHQSTTTKQNPDAIATNCVKELIKEYESIKKDYEDLRDTKVFTKQTARKFRDTKKAFEQFSQKADKIFHSLQPLSSSSFQQQRQRQQLRRKSQPLMQRFYGTWRKISPLIRLFGTLVLAFRIIMRSFLKEWVLQKMPTKSFGSAVAYRIPQIVTLILSVVTQRDILIGFQSLHRRPKY